MDPKSRRTRTFKRFSCCLLAGLLLAGPGNAKIEQIIISSDDGISAMAVPLLPPVSGWHHDQDASAVNAVNAMTPDGQTWKTAPAVFYGRAQYKPTVPDIKSVARLIDIDTAQIKQDKPGVAITELPPIRDADGQTMRCLRFISAQSGEWEISAYGEEGKYFLIFDVNANSAQALRDATPAFISLVAHYKA